MSSTPLFSVVIPTKNRPALLRDSIQSVLQQTGADFECIVSDNFNGEETIQVINQFKDHPKFKSVRTDSELNMLDHWEFASQKATGKFVLLLPDRKLLTQGALAHIERFFNKHPQLNVAAFESQVFDEETGYLGYKPTYLKKEKFASADLISDFVHKNYYLDSLDAQYPKTLNGVFRNSYAQQVRTKIGHYFNYPGVTTPDYSSFFVNCYMNEELGFINRRIHLTQGEKSSNGRNFGKGKVENYMKALGVADVYKHLSIKAPFIYNLLVNDWIVIHNAFRKNEPAVMDRENYFTTNITEYIFKKRESLLGKEEFDELFTLPLQVAYETEMKKDFQTRLNETEEIIRQQKTDSPFHLKLRDFLIYRLNNKTLNQLLKPKYKNGLEAGGF